MSAVTVSVNSVSAPSAPGAKPAKLWRRNSRKAIKKLMQACKVIQNMDFRELLRSTRIGATPLQFIGNQGSGVDNALRALINASTAALAETR